METIQQRDEEESAQRISKEAAFAEARDLVRERRYGVLSTSSKAEHGWPFGSVVPYALSPRGEPILYLAQIAEHYRNIVADDRVCLFVHGEPERRGDDVQEKGRVWMLGRARFATADERDDFWARYRARLPQADGYRRTHGFQLFAIDLTRVRFIGGFGKDLWLDAERFRLDPASDPLFSVAPKVIEHMNTDHQDALITYCRAFGGITPESAKLVGVDRYGLDIACREPNTRLRVEFTGPVDEHSIRQATIDLLEAARLRL